MQITWRRDEGLLSYGNRIIPVVCNIRNELNGRRKLDEKVVYSENEDGSEGMPYMPRVFPLGTWEVLAIIPKTDPYEAPEFLSTDARQQVHPWTSADGHYGVEMGDLIWDWGYGLHNSTSSTTLGCGRIMDYADREELFETVKLALATGDSVLLEVV